MPGSETIAAPMSFEAFLAGLRNYVDTSRLGQALAMLRAERFQLFAQADCQRVVGIVRSPSDASRLYSCRLAADGSFACCTQRLNTCAALRGAVCKHLLVLIIGLVRAGELDAAKVTAWLKASRRLRPALDRDLMSETFLKYKGVEAGDVDWRPTETIPEDYYLS